MVTLWCLQFSLKQPELCYWHCTLPIQGNAVKFISVLPTPNKSSKQGTIWQIRPWKCGFSMCTVKLLKSWMITAWVPFPLNILPALYMPFACSFWSFLVPHPPLFLVLLFLLFFCSSFSSSPHISFWWWWGERKMAVSWGKKSPSPF